MGKKYILLILVCFFAAQKLSAQILYQEDLKFRKWRLTLFPPVSTNGVATEEFTARYSINLLYGYHGGLDGIEIGGLANVTKFDANGIQIAGLANIARQSLQGIHIAGVGNFAGDDISGIQAAGIINIGRDEIEGFQVAGGLNFTKENISGIQIAGAANVGKEQLEGLQFSAGFNASSGDVSGIQLSGITNYSARSLEGLQGALGVNYARENISGLQFAGIGNYGGSDNEGLQFAGLFNAARKDFSGMQFSNGVNISGDDTEGVQSAGVWRVFGRIWDRVGLSEVGDIYDTPYNVGLNYSRSIDGLQLGGINLAGKIEGMQVGLINFSNNFEGFPVGILSYYSNGRKNFDFRVSDGGFSELGITLGTHRVYNMIILGENLALDRPVYRIGWAIGLERRLDDLYPRLVNNPDDWFINQEFSITHHFEDEFSRRLNLIYSYKHLLGKRFSENFSVYGGPSLNMQVTRVNSANDYTWYSFWSPEAKGRTFRFWIGFNLGVRLFKQRQLDPITSWRSDVDF